MAWCAIVRVTLEVSSSAVLIVGSHSGYIVSNLSMVPAGDAVAPGAINTRLTDEVLALGPEVVGAAEFAAAQKQKTSGGASLEKALGLVADKGKVVGAMHAEVEAALNTADAKINQAKASFSAAAATIGEALMLGAKADIPLPTVWEAIKSSAGNSWVAEHDVPSVFAGHYDPSFSLALCCKDLGLINRIARAQGYELPMGSYVQSLFEKAMSVYGESAAELHVVKLLEDQVGHYLRADLAKGR